MKRLVLLASAAILAGCASTYEIPTQSGIVKIKTYRNLVKATATLDPATGAISVTLEGVTDPGNKAIDALAAVARGGGQ